MHTRPAVYVIKEQKSHMKYFASRQRNERLRRQTRSGQMKVSRLPSRLHRNQSWEKITSSVCHVTQPMTNYICETRLRRALAHTDPTCYSSCVDFTRGVVAWQSRWLCDWHCCYIFQYILSDLVNRSYLCQMWRMFSCCFSFITSLL